MFYANSIDDFPKLPQGVNICEYLKPYADYPGEYSNKGPRVLVVSGDFWWVGYDLQKFDADAREKLDGKARSTGLLGTLQFDPPVSKDEAHRYKQSDAFTWMFLGAWPKNRSAK